MTKRTVDLPEPIDVRHRIPCRGSKLYVVMGRLGDPITRCRGCGAYEVHPKPGAEATPEPAAEPAPIGRYRCRVHHDEAVTWRGTGCRHCARERAAA